MNLPENIDPEVFDKYSELIEKIKEAEEKATPMIIDMYGKIVWKEGDEPYEFT